MRKHLKIAYPLLFELCPYGIWNSITSVGSSCAILIWTLSLWDLKLPLWISWLISFSHLNFVPMGFETQYRRNKSSIPFTVFELCPYGIWNVLPWWWIGRFQKIWTLSLWDLKLPIQGSVILAKRFELCPYGIWNSRTFLA